MIIPLDPPKEVLLPKQKTIYVATDISISETGNIFANCHYFRVVSGGIRKETVHETNIKQQVGRILVGNFYIRNHGKDGLH